MNIMDTIESNYVSADDLRGQDCPVRISEFRVEPVRKDNGQAKDEPVISFAGMQKSLVLNITNRLAIAGLYGEETDNWVGQSITLYPTTCQFRAKMVPCVRVRAFSPQPVGQQQQLAPPAASPDPPMTAAPPQTFEQSAPVPQQPQPAGQSPVQF